MSRVWAKYAAYPITQYFKATSSNSSSNKRQRTAMPKYGGKGVGTGEQGMRYISAKHGRRIRKSNKYATRLLRSLVPVETYKMQDPKIEFETNTGWQHWVNLTLGTPQHMKTLQTKMNQKAPLGAGIGTLWAPTGPFDGKWKLYDMTGVWQLKNQSQCGVNFEAYEVVARRDVLRYDASVADYLASLEDMVKKGFKYNTAVSGDFPNYAQVGTSLYENHIFCAYWRILKKKRGFIPPGGNCQIRLTANCNKTINPQTMYPLVGDYDAKLADGGLTRQWVIRFWGETVDDKDNAFGNPVGPVGAQYASNPASSVTTATMKIDIVGLRTYHYNVMPSYGYTTNVDNDLAHFPASRVAFINQDTGVADLDGDGPA